MFLRRAGILVTLTVTVGERSRGLGRWKSVFRKSVVAQKQRSTPVGLLAFYARDILRHIC